MHITLLFQGVWHGTHRCICMCVCTYIRTHVHTHAFSAGVKVQVLDNLTMGRMSYSTRNRVITMWKLKYTLKKIKARLEGVVHVSKTSLCLLIKKYKATGSVADYRPTARPKKVKEIHYQFIDGQMAKDDKLTGKKLLGMLKEEFPDTSVSFSTVKRAKRELGWMVKKTRYCALISENNQEKRVQWCQIKYDGDLEFEDVVWTDECIVQLESHRDFVFTKKASLFDTE